MTPQTLIHGDCMEYMRTLPDNAFDLAIVDPPYGLKPQSSCSGTYMKERIFAKSNISTWDVRPEPTYFSELFRVSKNQIIWGGNYFRLPPTRGIICWDKKQPLQSFSAWEMAWTSFYKPAKIFHMGNFRKGKIHPTQKPIELYKWLLENYAKEGDKILDTHLGSGSSAIAAYDLGFEFVGIEIDETYYNAAVKRFNEHVAQPRLDFGDSQSPAERRTV